MENQWLILAIFGAGVLSTLAGSFVTGLLVYKTRYAGEKIFTKERKPKGEAFNVDEDFIDDEIEPIEYPPVMDEANQEFVTQFNAEQMIRDLADIEKIEKQAEIDADKQEVLDDAT